LLRVEQIDKLDDDGDLKKPYKHWLAPIVADAEAGFGGPLNVFELVKALVEAAATIISGGESSTLALEGSTETEQFTEHAGTGEVRSEHGEEVLPEAQDVPGPADEVRTGTSKGSDERPTEPEGGADSQSGTG
jgi:hypothetical protein